MTRATKGIIQKQSDPHHISNRNEKKVRKQLVVLLALTLALVTAWAQQPQKINYRTSTFIKIAPDQETAMLDFMRVNSTKLIQAQMSAGQPIATWVLQRVVFSGVPAMEYNYIQTNDFNGAPQELNASARDQICRKAIGMSYQEYQQKLRSFGSVVGNILARVEATAPGSTVKEGSYIQVARWKITSQRGEDYGNYIAGFQLPLNTQAVKEGRILGWNAARVLSPGGADAPFDASTSTIVKDLASALPATLNDPNQAAMNFIKVFPGQSFVSFVDQGRALRKQVSTVLLRVMLLVER